MTNSPSFLISFLFRVFKRSISLDLYKTKIKKFFKICSINLNQNRVLIKPKNLLQINVWSHPSKTLSKFRQIILYAFLLIDQKKSFAKEKSPADEKLPKFSTQLRQKFNSPSARTEIFAYRNCSENLLTAIFRRRVLFSKIFYCLILEYFSIKFSI